MQRSRAAPFRRVATLQFGPTPRVNPLTRISYSDVYEDTGEVIKSPLSDGVDKASEWTLYLAILKLALLELANRLNVDWQDPPSWVPDIDDAIDSGLRATAETLHAQLSLGDDDDDTGAQRREQLHSEAASVAGIHSLPRLFSEIGLAFESVEREEGGVTRSFIDPGAGAREELLDDLVNRALQPFAAMQRLFGIDDVPPQGLQLRVAALDQPGDAPTLGRIEDLAIATCIAWTANVETSRQPPADHSLGFWLCDAGERRLSKTVRLDVQEKGGAMRFNLNLGANIGNSELEKMNEVLHKLVQKSSIL